MMHAVCALCGRVGRVELHHPTRRPGRGAAYFDPTFVVALCSTCHASVHQVLRVTELDWPALVVHPLSYRLCAWAAQVELWGAQGAVFPVAPSAASAVGAILREAAAVVDASCSIRERTA